MEELCFIDDELYLDTPIYDGRGLVGYKRQLLMTKEAFIACYNKWIKGEDGGNAE